MKTSVRLVEEKHAVQVHATQKSFVRYFDLKITQATPKAGIEQTSSEIGYQHIPLVIEISDKIYQNLRYSTYYFDRNGKLLTRVFQSFDGNTKKMGSRI